MTTLETLPSRDELITRYTRGECMVMGMTLAKRYNAELVGIFDDVWDTIPRHVGVRLSDGTYADAHGLGQSEAEFLEEYQYKGTRIGDMTPEDLNRIGGYRIENWNVEPAFLKALGL